MPTSSSDAIHPAPVSGSDADALASPPEGKGGPGEREPSALDSAADEADLLGESRSGEVEIDSGSGSGSATFALPRGLIAPDPIVRALSESPPPEEVREPAAPAEPGRAGAPGVSSSTGSTDPIGALRLDDGPGAPAGPAGPAPARVEGSDDQVEIEYVNGPNWPMVLLASYASAATLALIWWVVLPRLRGEPAPGGTPATAPATAPADIEPRRADRSRRVEPAGAIPADRITTLGRPLTVGSLEVTPLGVDRADVRLRRATVSGKGEEKSGGSGAMALRLRLRNISRDAVFAPLDEAFLRDRDDGPSESFVDIDGGDRVYLYPLTVNSEWSIVGQTFPDLRPGEAKEVRVISDEKFPPTTSRMTWRVKLRTGLEGEATIGVVVPGTP